MQQKFDLQTAPKQFCENIAVGFHKEFFVMAMMNGTTATAYTLTPQHAKRLKQYLDHQIAEYEKQNGVIKGTNWSPEIKSPVQFDKEK
jgi:hypothetical protein